MEFQLRDPDRIGFIIVAGSTFTYDEPGPHEIDVETLPPALRNQLLYNCRRGVLACSDPQKLTELCEGTKQVAKSYSTPAERPIDPAKPPIIEEAVDPIEEDLKVLRAMLRQSVPTIKREAKDLPFGRMRKLLELETKGKNRSGLKSFLSDILAKQADAVMNKVGDEDTGTKFTLTGVGNIGSKQVSDVVESEMKQIVLNPLEDTDE